MKITKERGETTTATERMHAARAVKHEAITRELLWAVIASRAWPACLMPSKESSPNLPALLVMEDDKMGTLLALAQSCTFSEPTT